MTRYTDKGFCDKTECENDYFPDKWGKIEAQKQGWFFGKNPIVAWCPEHIPDWVAEWRLRRALEREK